MGFSEYIGHSFDPEFRENRHQFGTERFKVRGALEYIDNLYLLAVAV